MPFPNPRCRCDRRRVRRACTRPAIADLPIAHHALALSLLQTIACADECSRCQDNLSHRRTTLRCPGCRGVLRFRCWLSCAAKPSDEFADPDFRMIRTCIPGPEKDSD